MESPFVNPWLLPALAAVVLPIVIGWLFRRRKRHARTAKPERPEHPISQGDAMRHVSTMLFVCAAAVFCGVMPASALAAPDFIGVPEVSDTGGTLRLTFVVAQYTDVTVEVLDSAGKCIRHLAAGRLGPNPPPPFQANSLRQTLTWGKKTDAGRPAPAGCKVRVGLGMIASFDRFYGGEGRGDMTGVDMRVNGAAADDKGNVYLLLKDGWSMGSAMLAYTRDNHYLRTLMPNYPGDLPGDKLKGFGAVTLANGQHVPAIYNGYSWTMARECIHMPRQGMITTPQGRVVVVGGGAQPWQKNNFPRTLIIGTDGSCPGDSLYGPTLPWPTVPYQYYYTCLAVSPDGKALYACGAPGHHSVAKSLLDFEGKMDLFLGEDATPGKDEKHFKDPRGVATDGKGNVYVSDCGNDRIMVFSPAGDYLAQAPCPNPDQIKVSPDTGEVYVECLEKTHKTVKVVKYSALPKLEPVCAVSLPLQMVGSAAVLPGMVLDCSGSRPMVWVGQLGYPAIELCGLEDQGTMLAPVAQKIAGKPAGATGRPAISLPANGLAVDREEKVLYSGGQALGGGSQNWVKVDLATGARARSAILADELAIGADGSIITLTQAGDAGRPTIPRSIIRRYDLNERRIAFEGGEMDWSGPPTHHTRGFAVAPNGDIHIITAEKTWGPQAVSTYGPDCKLKKDKVIPVPNAVAGIQGDRAGNIYIACNVRPKGVVSPPIYGHPIHPLLGDATKWPWGDHNAYRWMTGCILKFPSSGGKIVSHLFDHKPPAAAVPEGNLDGFNVPELQVDSDSTHALDVIGATWQYLGISPCVSDNNGPDEDCRCPNPRFCVDDFGMILVPDALSFSVVVLDNNKNEILRFGEYGNMDQAGAGSSRPNPAIPFCKVGPVVKVNNSVYVSDPGNQRIVKVKLDCAVVWSSDSGVQRAQARTDP
jgi:hypothetical protein